MGITNSITLYDSEFDFKTAKVDDVYFAFIVKMPFRFRVSSPYHCHFENRGTDYDMWIRNKPIGTTASGIPPYPLLGQGGSVDDLWSSVVVIPNKGRITAAELDAVQKCQGDVDKAPFESRTKQLFPAMQALNAFIIGYHSTTGELFGGHPLQILTVNSYMDSVAWNIALIGIPIAYWTADTISELFDLKVERGTRLVASLTGELTDLPPEKLVGIQQAIDRLDSFYFYELAFEAKSKMVSGDYIGALLLAVAALEGAHGAFVTNALASKLPLGRTGEDKKLEDKFIKELGFSLCNKLTPYLLMDAADRPAEDLIRKAAIAVTYRNDVMHALRKPTGKYKIRTRTNAELTDAYSAALQLYDIYRKAIERTFEGDKLA